MTARVAIAALVLAVPSVIQLRGRWYLLRRSLPAVLAFGLVAVAACQLCYFNAVAHLSVGVALLLKYSGILLVVLWLWWGQDSDRAGSPFPGWWSPWSDWPWC